MTEADIPEDVKAEADMLVDAISAYTALGHIRADHLFAIGRKYAFVLHDIAGTSVRFDHIGHSGPADAEEKINQALSEVHSEGDVYTAAVFVLYKDVMVGFPDGRPFASDPRIKVYSPIPQLNIGRK
jgi:hypothetical protein